LIFLNRTASPIYPTGVEELHGDPTVGPRPKVWTRGQKWKKTSRRLNVVVRSPPLYPRGGPK